MARDAPTSIIDDIIRFFQFAWGAILLGSAGWLLSQIRQTGVRPGDKGLIVTIAFSIPAVITGIVWLATRRRGNGPTYTAFGVLDAVHWIGYLAAAGLLRKNFNGPSIQNVLAQYIIGLRAGAGLNPHSSRVNGLVKLTVAGVVIQIILFFVTMVLSFHRARIYRNGAPTHRSKRDVGHHETATV